MRRLLPALALVACSDVAALDTFRCPWIRKDDIEVADAPEGTCWRIACPAGMAVTVPAADACVAAQSARVTVWRPSQRLASWARLDSSGELRANTETVPCP